MTRTTGRRVPAAAAALAVALLAAGCGTAAGASGSETGKPVPLSTVAGDRTPLPGMPPLLNPTDVYAADRPNALSPAVRNDLRRVYVPNHASNTVSVIDPATGKVLQTVHVPTGPEHVVPSWDLRTLWVNSDTGNALTPINPATGAFGAPVHVDDPYNLYFTPDGRYAVVMAERLHQIVFRDPHTMTVHKVLPVNCAGVNHADFSPNGRYFIVSCEYSGDLIKVDTLSQTIIGQQRLPAPHPMPQDVKISPDGRTWYIADMQTSGVWILDGDTFATPRLLPTGQGAHGLYVSRDSRHLYITNRGEGTISVLDFATNTIVAKWRLPGGGSPDMGGLSADGTQLWLSGRYQSEVYALDTGTGRLIYRIRVGAEPHGLVIWPQPGRYSLGHTGILR
ncbi:MAG TPA: YncE family protein [Rugosimonospora sp.]|nr:YncE family protein [Rugosimonospora sp.]